MLFRSAGLLRFKKKAKRIVYLASALGIPPPELSGWLAWEDAVAAILSQTGFNFSALKKRALLELDLIDPSVFREVFFGCRPLDVKDLVQADKLLRLFRVLSKKKFQSTLVNKNGSPAILCP